ncbi:MAG: N-acetyltransferase [Gammaproteobacteria bacterium]|nr:N-acetyltransferase [Gammaproteobacteria bacterium]
MRQSLCQATAGVGGIVYLASLELRIHHSLDEIDASAWNAMVRDNNPFIRHEFLAALEHHGCVGEEYGWMPCHVAAYDSGRLVGAMPLYKKSNSYGEFVFDEAWADAWRQQEMDYFPKLVSAIPYTPATGQRLLSLAGEEDCVYLALLQTAQQHANEIQASSLHCLFPPVGEHDFLSKYMHTRESCQFHWANKAYTCFDDFLAALVPKKRKNIRQERRRVRDQGIKIRLLQGDEASAQDWQDFALFYKKLFDEKWGTPTLNEGFFIEVARLMPQQTILVMADLDGQCVAGALMYRSDTTLYGRHWGCIEQLDALHFEACYYQGIEYCIKQGLQSFEPGAGGEHKMARGFVPVITHSNHWLLNKYFDAAIKQFVQREREGVRAYVLEQEARSPYR